MTTVGLAGNLNNRTEYSTMTRMTGPYKLIFGLFYRLFRQQQWTKAFYYYHDDTSYNKPHSECYMLMASLGSGLTMVFRQTQNYDAINIPFDENSETRETHRNKLRSASFRSNGKYDINESN